MQNPPPSPERKVHPLEAGPRRPVTAAPAGPHVYLQAANKTPIVTYTLIAVNVLLFVLRLLSPTFNEQAVMWGANSAQAVLGEGEVWRLLTSMFLHASIYNARDQFVLEYSIHILLNMSALYYSGPFVERLFGHVRFLGIYLLGGLTGSLLSALSGVSLAVGASGAVFAIFGAEIAFLLYHRTLLGARGRAHLRGLLIFAGMNLAFGFTTNLFGAGIRIDNWAHLGGALGGFALTWLIGPRFELISLTPEAVGPTTAADRSDPRRSLQTAAFYGAGLVVVLLAGMALGR